MRQVSYALVYTSSSLSFPSSDLKRLYAERHRAPRPVSQMKDGGLRIAICVGAARIGDLGQFKACSYLGGRLQP